MKKLLCLVLVSSLLLVTLAGAASYPLPSPLSRQQAQVLGRKGRELGQLGYHYQHEGKQKQQPEEENLTVHVQEAAMEVKKSAETKAGWADQGVDAKEGLIYSADYSGVAMHAGSPPKHKHSKP
ncbi:uncharacterized protein LOC133887808 isoform X1 [Phragmites australis]|uniref:uncharacterized protein LOC133887808 isoform X1 n=1 Tax=Phragmites australis TaxID=29695 RepID=UPI002D76AA32|nr:uncharacterized protein LOC133887808 isoform X1 [Phragmites australis]